MWGSRPAIPERPGSLRRWSSRQSWSWLLAVIASRLPPDRATATAGAGHVEHRPNPAGIGVMETIGGRALGGVVSPRAAQRECLNLSAPASSANQDGLAGSAASGQSVHDICRNAVVRNALQAPPDQGLYVVAVEKSKKLLPVDGTPTPLGDLSDLLGFDHGTHTRNHQARLGREHRHSSSQRSLFSGPLHKTDRSLDRGIGRL